MEAYLVDWLSLIVRWLHLITGIAWIGASFHFVWLDNSLQEPDDELKAKGVKGDLWAIHGGGIYHFSKYSLAPPSWPVSLHWSKWEAYSTWITGTFLMIAVYYFQAQSYLVGPDNWISSSSTAVAASVAFLLGGLALYEVAIRSPLRKNEGLFAMGVALMLILLSWLATKLFSDRAVFLHVGALMGTIMAGNVFLGIIPIQKRFVAAVEAGGSPDPAEAAFAKQRSTFNNYFTLPVLFCMISNHYPFLYGHEWNWVILVAVMMITAYSRHFFNLRHRGIIRPMVLVQAFIGFLVLASWLGYERYDAQQALLLNQVEDDIVIVVVAKHCVNCHAVKPTQPGFVAPPGGIVLESLAQLLQHSQQVETAVSTGYMPLANMTGMTDEERTDLLAWIAQNKNL